MTVKGVGWVQRLDAEAMEKKAEDALKMKKTIEKKWSREVACECD